MSVYVKDIPFSYVGKGLQTILKTNVSLSSKKTEKSSIVLIEEPENHLSFSTLNSLIKKIEENNLDKQIIITSHSSFIANKLGLENVTLLSDATPVPFSGLDPETKDFFKKLPGYDTLRILLCKKAILVEGDADELIVQRAYKDRTGRLPIEDGIDVISVNNTYKRFFELVKSTTQKISLVVDVDSQIKDRQNFKEEYADNENIEIFFEENDKNIQYMHTNTKDESVKINMNTLEPLLVKYNNFEILNKIFDKNFKDNERITQYMINNKTDCALKIFNSPEKIQYPKYITEAIDFVI